MKTRDGYKFEPTPEEAEKLRAAEAAQFAAIVRVAARSGVGVFTEGKK